MFCNKCGKPLSRGDQRFCPECGTPPLLSPQPAPSTSSSVIRNPKVLVLSVGAALAIIAAITLHQFSAFLAIVLIVIAGFAMLRPGIKLKLKLAGLVVGLLIVLISNGIEGWQESKSQEKANEQTKQQAVKQAATESEQKRLQELAFAQLSPKEHLDKARSLLKVEGRTGGKQVVDTQQFSQDDARDALAHLDAITASAPEYADAQQLRKAYEAALKRRDEENTRSQVAADKKQALDEAALLSRKTYAQALQKQLNSTGIDITVWVSDQQPDELVMDSDLFKDTDNRVYFVQNTLPKSRRNLCALGVRQVRLIRGGVFSLGDAYSVGCPEAKAERVEQKAGAREEIAQAINDPDGTGHVHARVDGTTLVVISEYYFDDPQRRNIWIQGIWEPLWKEQQKLCDAEFTRVQFRGTNPVKTVPIHCR